MPILERVAVIGGDRRAIYSAIKLNEKGASCTLFGLEEEPTGTCRGFRKGLCKAPYLLSEALKEVQTLLLPIPVSADDKAVFAPFSDRTILLSDLAEAIPPSVLLFGGKIPDLFKEKCRCHDFLEDPVFAAANALPTAESALGLVLLEREGILWKSSCALFGYGNIAKELTSRLLTLGCTVTVFARREDARREAEKAGAIALPLESALELSSHFDLLFNTIPAPVISPALAAGFRAEALYMELASKPYGLSAEAKSALRCSYRLASGLPGKYCPKKAGEILADRILELYENI